MFQSADAAIGYKPMMSNPAVNVEMELILISWKIFQRMAIFQQ